MGSWDLELGTANQRLARYVPLSPFTFHLSPFPFTSLRLYLFTPSASTPSAAQVPPMPARAGCSPAAREFHLTTMTGPLRTPSQLSGIMDAPVAVLRSRRAIVITVIEFDVPQLGIAAIALPSKRAEGVSARNEHPRGTHSRLCHEYGKTYAGPQQV